MLDLFELGLGRLWATILKKESDMLKDKLNSGMKGNPVNRIVNILKVEICGFDVKVN